jgi:hypothetical protein
MGSEVRSSSASQINATQQLNVPEEESSPVTMEAPAVEIPANIRSNFQTMLGDLGFDGQMRQLEFQKMFPPNGGSISPNLFADPVVHADSSPAPTTAMKVAEFSAKLDAAKVPQKLKEELMALTKNRPGIDVRILIQNSEAALKSSDPATALKSVVLQTRADDYYESFNATYNINGAEVQATPHFRMSDGMSGPKGRTSSSDVQDDLNTLIAKKDKGHYNDSMIKAIHGTAYGRATPQQVKMVTESLIRSGQYEVAQKKHPGLSESETIRMMQWDHGVGIDCAGYVQQAFMAVHKGGRDDFKFKDFGSEDLMSLKGNPKFVQVKPQDVRPGDLIALDKPPGEAVGHTVLVRDQHLMTPTELGKYKDPDGFAKADDKVHVYEIDGSFGGGEFGDHGGLVRKTWMYNERTSQWAEIAPDDLGNDKLQVSQTNGPYNHPMNGIYRPGAK